MLTRAALILAAAANLPLVGCSSNNLQDINKGTDVAAGWVPPDAGTAEAAPLDAQAIDTSASTDDTSASTDDGDGSTDDGSVDAAANEDG